MTVDILLVEDDPAVMRAVSDALDREGWTVRAVTDGAPALHRARERKPDLVICDIGLPTSSGLDVLQQLHRDHPGLPVILLTARREEVDKVVGLELGATDYVTKPFSPRELVARVRARLRGKHVVQKAPEILELGPVTIDLKRRILSRAGQEQLLSVHEAGTLAYLSARAGQDVARDALLSEVWGHTTAVTTRSVDNLVSRLRKKIEQDPATPRHLLTVHGTGYRFEP